MQVKIKFSRTVLKINANKLTLEFCVHKALFSSLPSVWLEKIFELHVMVYCEESSMRALRKYKWLFCLPDHNKKYFQFYFNAMLHDLRYSIKTLLYSTSLKQMSPSEAYQRCIFLMQCSMNQKK